MLEGSGSPLLVLPDLVTIGGWLCSPHSQFSSNGVLILPAPQFLPVLSTVHFPQPCPAHFRLLFVTEGPSAPEQGCLPPHPSWPWSLQSHSPCRSAIETRTSERYRVSERQCSVYPDSSTPWSDVLCPLLCISEERAQQDSCCFSWRWTWQGLSDCWTGVSLTAPSHSQLIVLYGCVHLRQCPGSDPKISGSESEIWRSGG